MSVPLREPERDAQWAVLRPCRRARSLVAVAFVVLSCASSAGQELEQSEAGTAQQEASTAQQKLRPADARPAPGPYPAPPGVERTEDEPPPAPAELARDAAVVGRLTAEGQAASLEFEARAGELSLFDLTAYGYTRGWDASSRLVVRGPGGDVLAERSRSGPALFSDLLVFTAPAAGAYTLEVVAERHYFRYLVVRHSSYRAGAPGEAFAVPEEGDVVVHGFTGGRDTPAGEGAEGPTGSEHTAGEMRFVVRGVPGALMALRAEPTIERGREHKRSLRSGAAAVTAGLADARRLAQRMDPRQRDDPSFPDFTVQVEDAAERGTPLASGAFSALVRVPASGALFVTVGQSNEGPGGLFDLTVERGITLAPCTLRFGDTEDDPVAGVEVVLLREPALEPMARGTSGPDGTVTIHAPIGPTVVVYRAPEAGVMVERTTLASGTTLNLFAER